MKTLMKLGGLAAVCVMLPACATITRGTSQKFTVKSEPSEAHVRLSTGQTCVTPCTLTLKRKSEFAVTVSKEGYQTQEEQVHGVVKGGGAAGMAGNILFGGIIGVGVDASNGSLMNLTPNPLVVTLQPGTAAAATAPVAATAVEAAPAAAVASEVTPATSEAPAASADQAALDALNSASSNEGSSSL